MTRLLRLHPDCQTGRRQAELDAAVKQIGKNVTAVQVMKTYAPSATNRLAVANPMPLLPPVTTATFPSNFPMISLPKNDSRTAG
jgi:hypothetical protein